MTEEWRPVAGWEHVYQVSDHGRVRSIPRSVARSDGKVFHYKGQVLRPAMRDRAGGYPAVGLSYEGRLKTYPVHRLVAIAFVPNPEGLETVNHKDGDKRNIRAENLEWMSVADNVKHGFAMGLIPLSAKGERHKNAKLLDKSAEIIRKEPQRYGMATELAKRYGVSVSTIHLIRRGKRYA